MASTAPAIRDRIIDLIEALTPRTIAAGPGNKFRHYRNEGGANFLEYADANAASAFRRFQVRYLGVDEPPPVSNQDTEQRQISIVVLVAYPHNARAGVDQALDRDDLMSLDQHQIEYAIGMNGRANFSSTHDAAWLSGSTDRVIGNACDFLEIRQIMTFYRVMP